MMGRLATVRGIVIAGALSGHGCVPLGGSPPSTRPAVSSPAYVPAWAIHVVPLGVDPNLPAETVIGRLTGELQAPRLTDGHLPAEQIAAAAIQSLDAGYRTDAAMLLAIASYRYREQLQHIREVGYNGLDRAPYRVNDSAYYKLLKDEIAIYESLDFADEMRSLTAFLRGEDTPDADLRSRLAELFRTGPVDEETFRELIRQKLAAGAAVTSETLHAPALADAFLGRLRADAKNKLTQYFAVSALANTPTSVFQSEALRLAPVPVSPRICSALADQLVTNRELVAGLLADPNQATRASSAVVMGMNPSPEQLAALEQRWATEREPAVRLSLAYALARHGRRERVGDLTTALNPCVGQLCAQTVVLLQWLPEDMKARLDQETVAALVGDPRQNRAVHFFAAALLRDIALRQPLGAHARDALLVAARDRDPGMGFITAEAIARDSSLSRARVIALLETPPVAFRPLLARLARVVTSADLPLLASLMPRFARDSAPEAEILVEAAATLPGPEAEAQLLNWFDAYKPLRLLIAFRILGKSELRPEVLQHVSQKGDVSTRLLVKLAIHAPDAISSLNEQLRAGQPGDRLLAARLAGAVRDPRTRDGLWKLAMYRDARYYPRDAILRHAAMVSLLRIAFTTLRPPQRPPGQLAVNGLR